MGVINETAPLGYVLFDLYTVNDNPGVEFNSLEIFAQNIFDTLYRKTQQYGTFNGTKAEFLAALSYGIGTESEIVSGWYERDGQDAFRLGP